MITSILERFGVELDEPVAGLESRSGAGIHAVWTSAGERAFLKLTAAVRGSQARGAADRELRFYRQIAPAAPIRTPRLLNAVDDDEVAALLLEATGATVDVRSWSSRNWAALGRDLAALHDLPVPDGESWARQDGLNDALNAPDLRMVEMFWGPTLPRLADLIVERATLSKTMAALPPVLVHGDCHTENIAVAGDSLIFLDWQVSGLGRPSTDLTFPDVRAKPAGVTAPPELVANYLRHRDVDQTALELALLAEELAVYVFQWPWFAAGPRLRRRVRQQRERWHDASTTCSPRSAWTT
nr:aminoglycoside phosphotransferase family protein [uncultured Actinoplanes sp.]